MFDFKDPLIKRAIHAIKYYHRKDLIAPLVESLEEELRKIPQLETYTLVPIPMPRMRKLFRGYNQAEQIAYELSKILKLKTEENMLARSRSPIRQVKTKSKKEREENQSGSFVLLKNPAGMNLLLVDDVTTTGATLSEARKILLKNGASTVRAATLAH